MFGEEIDRTDMEQAAALVHGITGNQAFVDGKKRTATFAVRLFLDGRRATPGAWRPPVAMPGELAIETASRQLSVADVTGRLHCTPGP